MSSSTQRSRKVFLSFGNPLLDIVVDVTPSEETHLVATYGLRRGVGQEMDTKGMLRDVADKSSTLVPGGCALNTCRVLCWLDAEDALDSKFFGSIGRDDHGTALTSKIKESGILPRLCEQLDLPTGHCVALVCGMERTLCAMVGAADRFTLEDYEALGVEQCVNEAAAVYLTSFFAKHSFEVVSRVAQICSGHNIPLAFNLNGEYVFQDHTFVKRVVDLLPEVNVLFGNRNEFLTFVSCSRRLGYKSKILNAISNFFEVPQHESQQTSLIERYTDVVVTDGPADVISFKVDNSGAVHDVESVATPSLAPGDIVDTIGAGDAFVAGYMEALMMARGRRECMRRGIYASQAIIGQVGTNLPMEPAKVLDSSWHPTD